MKLFDSSRICREQGKQVFLGVNLGLYRGYIFKNIYLNSMRWTFSLLSIQLCARTYLTRQGEVHTHRGRRGNFNLIVKIVLTGSSWAKLKTVCSQLEQIYIELSIFKYKSRYWFLNKIEYSNVICRILVYYFTICRDLTLT